MLSKVITPEWAQHLSPNISKEYFDELGKILYKEYNTNKVLPPLDEIFNAFKFTRYEDTKIVFLGLDPYIRQGQAYGVSFGIRDSCITIPSSLRNIYKEIESDVYEGLSLGFDYSLKSWCDQGCLMLNVALTVIEGKTGSHLKIWDGFTKSVFKTLNKKEFCIFVLLGRKAQEYKKYIEDKPNFHIIQAAHPAAEAYSGGKAGFFNSKIFSKINTILINNNKQQIKW